LVRTQSYHKQRTASWYIVNCSLLKPLKQGPIAVTSLRLSQSLYSGSVTFKRINNFGPVFTNHLDRRTYETKFSTKVSLPPPPILYFSSDFKFPLYAHNPPFFPPITLQAMLSLYQSAVYCWGGSVEGKSTHEENYLWDLCSSGILRCLDLYLVSEVSEHLIGTAFKGQPVR